MSVTKPPAADRPAAVARRRGGRAVQAGIITVEFALLAIVFFTFIFGVIEVARALYLFNTLQEVTRRAAQMAAVTDFSSPAAMAALRRQAVFRSTAGALLLGDPVTDQSIQIQYLSVARSGAVLTLTPVGASAMPACPARNVVNCVHDPNGAACIGLVQVMLCGAGAGACPPLAYAPMLPLVKLSFPLPPATAIVRAGSLGYQPGMPLCP
ncbi:TadE/TadG family type IV pilus assembly protein [Rugamonas sp.]|uniref:TadE/TadG family type IV pilus assembly protein n=1 Tax=Rugamonas sp. TaxID=1926287 RepID=UPI0025FD870C|nr:TadE/TadG family type IV pilus assembly protein [Rugamonas sp.]